MRAVRPSISCKFTIAFLLSKYATTRRFSSGSVSDWQHNISGVSRRSFRTFTDVPPSTSMRTRRSLHVALAWNKVSDPLLFITVKKKARVISTAFLPLCHEHSVLFNFKRKF